MPKKIEKSSDSLEPKEKGESQVLRRAESARKLREAPDHVPTRGEVVRDLKKYGIEVDHIPEWKKDAEG